MSSAAILNAGQHDPHLLAAKAVKDSNLMADKWTQIDVHNPRVEEIAEFAVAEHNKEKKDHLIYMCVVSGASNSMIGGTTYCLMIKAKCGNMLPPQVGLYGATVWEGMTNPISRQLECFVPLWKN